MKKIVIYVGSRANFGRLRSLIKKLIELNTYKVELIQGYYKLPEFKEHITWTQDNLMYYDTDANTIIGVTLTAQSVSNYLINSRLPDLAVVHADRYENLGFALSCAYNKVPLLHTEGGEISGNIDDKVRNAITALADYHCTASNLAFKKLYESGVKSIFFTGSPAIDYIYELSLIKSKKEKYILVLYHPTDNEDFDEFLYAISRISKEQSVIWINPNIDPGSKKLLKKVHSLKRIIFLKDLIPEEYYNLLANCYCLIGNTSSGIKEGFCLEVPYILVGDRQKGREVGNNVIRVRCNSEDIIKAFNDIDEKKLIVYDKRFGNGTSVLKIIEIIKEILGDEERKI